MLIVNGFISIFCKQPDIMWQLLCQKKNQPRRQKEEESERLPKRRLLKCQQRHYVTLVLSIRFLVVHIVAVVDKRFLKYKNGIYLNLFTLSQWFFLFIGSRTMQENYLHNRSGNAIWRTTIMASFRLFRRTS